MLARQTPYTVLVVEDEWLVRSDIVSELSAQGAQVLEASTGEAALNLFEMDPVCDLRVKGNSIPHLRKPVNPTRASLTIAHNPNSQVIDNSEHPVSPEPSALPSVAANKCLLRQLRRFRHEG